MIDKALEYHCLDGVPGKLSVVPTKPCMSAEDLSYAYTPGVAKPVLEIEKDSEEAYHYTDKGNLVAVVSNGTAILGLGDRGALASKPVMEGKGVLFKRFADIDVYDIEVDEKDPDKLVAIVKAISPTFGGINLEHCDHRDCGSDERMRDCWQGHFFLACHRQRRRGRWNQLCAHVHRGRSEEGEPRHA